MDNEYTPFSTGLLLLRFWIRVSHQKRHSQSRNESYETDKKGIPLYSGNRERWSVNYLADKKCPQAEDCKTNQDNR